MGTETRGRHRALAAVLFAAALMAPTLGASYTEYSNATLQNQLNTLRIQRDLYKFVTAPSGPWNGWLMAKIQTNQTMTQNWTYRLYSYLLETIATNATPQGNLNSAFLTVGMNASQLNCGNASGGNCKTQAGLQGRSRVGNETIQLVRGNAGNVVTDMARLRAEMFKYWAIWYVDVQEGIVALLDTASG